MSPQLGTFTVPAIDNEPMYHYGPGSPERKALQAAITELQQQLPIEVPCIVNGKPVKTGKLAKQPMPHDHANHLCTYNEADPQTVASAIDGALAAKEEWEALPWNDRAAIFLKAAELVSGKYRYKLMAATMLGQGKNAWQAEIDAAAELADFLRFGVKFVERLYSIQPEKNSSGVWNRTEYRALEGFVLAISPFNFTAIGGNLCGVPALLGNVVVWKPAPMATLANYITYQIFTEAGIPPGVIQFVPGPPPEVVAQAINHNSFAALHFTGSTTVFKKLWKDISANLDSYRGYPRIVGETGGKNWHLVHESADTRNAVLQSVRATFEYSGQKCSALSRLYVSASQWKGGFKDQLLSEVAKVKVGNQLEWSTFVGPVINRTAYDKIMSYIQKAKDAGGQILIGGTGDDSKGYFIQPTVVLTQDPKSVTMVEEIFGPVLTVYVYKDEEYEKTLQMIDETSVYGLTGAIYLDVRKDLYYWSSDPDGQTAMPKSQFVSLGFPSLLQKFVAWQEAKGFDPLMTDFVYSLGYPIMETVLVNVGADDGCFKVLSKNTDVPSFTMLKPHHDDERAIDVDLPISPSNLAMEVDDHRTSVVNSCVTGSVNMEVD